MTVYDIMKFHVDNGSNYYIFLNGKLEKILMKEQIREDFKLLKVKSFKCHCSKVIINI